MKNSLKSTFAVATIVAAVSATSPVLADEVPTSFNGDGGNSNVNFCTQFPEKCGAADGASDAVGDGLGKLIISGLIAYMIYNGANSDKAEAEH